MSILPQQTQQLFDEYIAKIPDEYDYIRDTIKNFDWQNETYKIGSKFKLPHDKNIKFVVEVGMILINIADPAEFIPEIIKISGVTEETAVNIAKEVHDRIFEKMQSKVLTNYKEDIEYMQNRLAEETAKESEQTILEHTGIEIMDENQTINTKKTEETIPEDLNIVENAKSTKYEGHDPYHEPIE